MVYAALYPLDYTSENITPGQLALLDRRNSDQYPASQEDSDGKGSTFSSDKQEDGEESSEVEEPEDFGHGPGHSGGTEAGTAEEDERRRRDAEEEREKQEAGRRRKEEERKRKAAEEERKQ